MADAGTLLLLALFVGRPRQWPLRRIVEAILYLLRGGWSIQGRQTTDVVLQALHMSVWRRKPKQGVLIHLDQGLQFTNMDRAAFIPAHNLENSMSEHGNCHANFVADSFFSSLKRERIRRRFAELHASTYDKYAGLSPLRQADE